MRNVRSSAFRYSCRAVAGQNHLRANISFPHPADKDVHELRATYDPLARCIKTGPFVSAPKTSSGTERGSARSEAAGRAEGLE